MLVERCVYVYIDVSMTPNQEGGGGIKSDMKEGETTEGTTEVILHKGNTCVCVRVFAVCACLSPVSWSTKYWCDGGCVIT